MYGEYPEGGHFEEFMANSYYLLIPSVNEDFKAHSYWTEPLPLMPLRKTLSSPIISPSAYSSSVKSSSLNYKSNMGESQSQDPESWSLRLPLQLAAEGWHWLRASQKLTGPDQTKAYPVCP